MARLQEDDRIELHVLEATREQQREVHACPPAVRNRVPRRAEPLRPQAAARKRADVGRFDVVGDCRPDGADLSVDAL